MINARQSNINVLRTILTLTIAGFSGIITSCSLVQRQSVTTVQKSIIIPAGNEPLDGKLIERIGKTITASDSIRPIGGNVYLGQVLGNRSKPQDHLERALVNLGETINRYTNLDVRIDAHLSLENFKHHETPLLIISADTTFILTDSEQKQFRTYLRDGGFAIIDNTTPESSNSRETLKKILRDSIGEKITFKPVPYSHPIFHCFFDFTDGQPSGKVVEIEKKNQQEKEEKYQYFHDDLEGIWLDNRMVAIFSNNGYCFRWKALSGNGVQLKLGVNLIIYSLLREGGILHRSNRIQSH